MACGRKDGRDGRTIESAVQAKQHERGGHLRARVPSGNERVGLALWLEPETDGHRAVWLPADGGARLVVHLDDLRRLDDVDALAERRRGRELIAKQACELLFD